MISISDLKARYSKGSRSSKGFQQFKGWVLQGGKLGLAAISLWETQMLHARGRLVLPMPFAEWLEAAADDRMITILPLDVQVVTALDGLPSRFHGDPADRLIVATARSHRLTLATTDASIRRSRVVPIWRP